MMVGTIRINGQIIDRIDIKERIQKNLEEAKELVSKNLNRESRRGRKGKFIISLLTMMGTIGIAAVANAESLDPNLVYPDTKLEPVPEGMQEHKGILGYVFDKITGSVKDKLMGEISYDKEGSGMWQLNEYMSKTIFTNKDFFHDASIVSMFNTIWMIILSLVTLIVSKKGFDMIRARIVGAHSQGATEFIIRLLASCLMTFLTLDIMSLGIQLSNLSTGVLMHSLANGMIQFQNVFDAASGAFGAFFWMIGFIVSFALMAVRYWVRQINMIILGCLAPIANMAWVTDGGSMLGILIREFVICLTTPIIQAIVMGIGTTILMSVGTAGTVGAFNAIFIGLSIMFIMIFTPEFLRKFTTGSANPLKYAFSLFLKAKSLPLSFMKAMK